MSTSSSSTFHTSFPLFPLLPPELRLQIWRLVPQSRVITLSYLPSPYANDDTYTYHTPNTRPPRLLHICRESRAEGQKIYIKCSIPTIHPGYQEQEQEQEQHQGEEEEERYFHLHPHLDILYLPRPQPGLDPAGYSSWAHEFGQRMPVAAAAARRLAVDYVPAELRRPWEVYGKLCLLRGCARLEEAFLVISSLGSGGSPPSPLEGEVEGLGLGMEEGGMGWGNGMMQEVEFVDPKGEPGEIMGIMERVRESFRFEVDGGGNGGVRGLLGRRGAGDDDDDGCKETEGLERGLELIPKAKKKKVLRDWGCWVGYAACTGSGVRLVV
ncbi:hypothetical protein MFIFM68171_06807 [Madurella fahalii]|uniref:2EXR domain-containing protein n=1 Tax=Madurella fahalii TaxID=1157608 RepID=A0ABQ0GFQ7_9PEZI